MLGAIREGPTAGARPDSRHGGATDLGGRWGLPTVASWVEVLLFAQARQAVGAARVAVPVGRSGVSLAELLRSVQADHPALAPVLAKSRVAVNGTYTPNHRIRVRPGDQVAIHPPFSGG